MDITKVVAKLRFNYHSNMLNVNNVLNQLGLRKDDVAEAIGKKHCMQCFDCLERLGYDVWGYIERFEDVENGD